MEKVIKTLTILNLAGELQSGFRSYLSSRNIVVVDAVESKGTEDWTHILTKDVHDFDQINKAYKVVELDRHIITISRPNDLQNFTLNNGNLVLNDLWFHGPMGPFIVDKYFQGYGGISLGDNYPTFQELGSFNVANPFNTGEYLDRMVQKAFESGIEALTVKTYFDHLVMYVAGLKKKGRAGLPFEVTYGTFENIFALQVHFFSQHLEMLDVTTSLSSTMTKKAEEYFLNVSVQSADFFDFTHMPEVNKVVITGLWSQDERLTFESRGCMFTSLTGGAALTQYEMEGGSSVLVSEPAMEDFTHKVVIPDLLSVEVPKTVMKGSSPEALAISVVKGMAPEELAKTIVKAMAPEELAKSVVKGMTREELTNSIVKGMTPDEMAKSVVLGISTEELVKNVVKGMAREEIPDTILPGTAPIAATDSPEWTMTFEESAEAVIPGTPEEIAAAQIVQGEKELAELVQTVKGKLEEEKSVFRLAGNKLDIDKTVYKIAASVDQSAKENNYKVRSFGDQLPETIKTGLFDYAKNLNKEVDDLSDSDINMFEETRIPEIIKAGMVEQSDKKMFEKIAPEPQGMVVKSLGGNKAAATAAMAANAEAMKLLEARLLTSNAENEKFKTQLKALTSEVRILKESRSKLVEIQMKATQAAAEVTVKTADPDDVLRKQFQQKLTDQKILNEAELKKLGALLERESKLIADVKQEELKARKVQIEAAQKENFFAQELEKSERMVKGKDIILIKTKETFTKILEKKERELEDFKAKTEQLTKALAVGPSTTQTQVIKDLEKQNQNLSKQLEVYKVKITSLANNIHTKTPDDNIKEEARKLQMVNQQLKNQLDLSKKESEKWQAKASAENSQLMLLRQEKAKLEMLIKKTAQESAKEAESPRNQMSDQELKRLQAQNQILETHVKDSSLKITNLENKILELLKPQKQVAAGDDSNKVKLTQLENSVKKLTQDLVESRNQLGEAKKETNKLRQDKTALQNQLDKLKKEADKGKPALPKKPGGKAA